MLEEVIFLISAPQNKRFNLNADAFMMCGLRSQAFKMCSGDYLPCAAFIPFKIPVNAHDHLPFVCLMVLLYFMTL